MHHLPNAGDWDIVKGLSLTENIQLLLCEWKSREKTQVSGVGFSTALLKSQSFLFFRLSVLDIGAGSGGWGRGRARQPLLTVTSGTSWKLHCVHLFCHRVCFFKQFDILSRQQPGKFAFQMQLLWVPVSTWSIFAPFPSGGLDPHTWLTAAAGCAMQPPLSVSPHECQILSSADSPSQPGCWWLKIPLGVKHLSSSPYQVSCHVLLLMLKHNFSSLLFLKVENSNLLQEMSPTLEMLIVCF